MPSDKPNYFELVYQVVGEIPKGRVTSYGAIAHYLGIKSGARMVGYAMNAAHSLPEVPAHRVVNRQGLLTGKHHFATPTRMEKWSIGVASKDKYRIDDALIVEPIKG